VLLCVTVSLMPTLLPVSDESAMNLEGLGIFFRNVLRVGSKFRRESGFRRSRGNARCVFFWSERRTWSDPKPAGIEGFSNAYDMVLTSCFLYMSRYPSRCSCDCAVPQEWSASRSNGSFAKLRRP
jgi:hypothetical protein